MWLKSNTSLRLLFVVNATKRVWISLHKFGVLARCQKEILRVLILRILVADYSVQTDASVRRSFVNTQRRNRYGSQEEVELQKES
jgi:hypothetical protein